MIDITVHGGPKGKIIRDAVHGDIFIEDKFLQVIDTPEFQRMRRIKQLAADSLVFPSADHSRFSHSLGCFAVMKRIISRFDGIFQDMGLTISQHDRDIALLAALLHDIGHGPFSHAFETLQGSAPVSHEVWTSRIIRNPKGAVFQRIEAAFGPGAAAQTSELIEKQRQVKDTEENYVIEHIDLFSVLSSLVSSQLDADRLDYLLRDSYHCGVSFGKIDISRIITALSLTVYDNQYYVCVPEKYLDDIENYLLARYHMHSTIYFHDMKVQMEQVLHKIFQRAKELHQAGDLPPYPPALEALFSDRPLQVEDYIKLDDAAFWSAFQTWSSGGDPHLADYCAAILYRNKLSKITALDGSNSAYRAFKQDFCKLLETYGCAMTEDALPKSPFWIETRYSFSAYKPQKDNIWIQTSSGLVVDISQRSKLIHAEDLVLLSEHERGWINRRLLETLPLSPKEGFQSDLDRLIQNYDIRSTIEIEKKYHFQDESVFQEVLDYLRTMENRYQLTETPAAQQTDDYYDTPDQAAASAKSTLRIRRRGGQYELTVKRPTAVFSQEQGQNERFEFCRPIPENTLAGQETFLLEHLPQLQEGVRLFQLAKRLTVENLRTAVIIRVPNTEAVFEMALDRVIYRDSQGREARDFQIEIELKSAYLHRVSLKMLTDDLEKRFPQLEASSVSKYKRGLAILEGLKEA